jgi:hypothetical protein
MVNNTMSTFTYKSTEPQIVHSITHNLNDYPVISIYVRNQETGIYEYCIAQVELITLDLCTVTFNQPLNCVIKFMA